MAANTVPRRRTKSGSRRHKPRQRKKVRQLDRTSVPLWIHLVRLIILALGSSTIAGTTISIANQSKPPIKLVQPVVPAKIVPKEIHQPIQEHPQIQDRDGSKLDVRLK